MNGLLSNLLCALYYRLLSTGFNFYLFHSNVKFSAGVADPLATEMAAGTALAVGAAPAASSTAPEPARSAAS